MAGPIAYRGNEVWLIHHAFAATSLAGSLLWEPVQTSRGLRARLIRAGRHKTSTTPGKLDERRRPQPHGRPHQRYRSTTGGAVNWDSRSRRVARVTVDYQKVICGPSTRSSIGTRADAPRYMHIEGGGAATWWHKHRACDIGLV